MGAIRVINVREGGWDIRPRGATAGWDLEARRWESESPTGLAMASHIKKPSARIQISEKKCLLGRHWVRWKSQLWGHDLRWVCWESGGVV